MAAAAAGEPALAVPDVLAYLTGRWQVDRRLTDRAAGASGSFAGQASFTPDPADPRLLAYHEQGELRFGTHQGPAWRRLRYLGQPDGTAEVWFDDDRAFYRLDPRPGTWQAVHPCGADHYQVTGRILGPDQYTETWRTTGPRKDQELVTVLTRIDRPDR